MIKDKWLLLSVIENYLILTNTFSCKNNYLIDYLYALHLYKTHEELELYLKFLKSEYIEYSKYKPIKVEFNYN